MGLSKELFCEARSFSHCCVNPHGCFQSEVRGFISPSCGPGLRGLLCSPTLPPILSMCECGAAGSASGRTACPVHSTIHHSLGPAALPRSRLSRLPVSTLLPVWTNVSSLSPWLSDFRAVQFSVSSGCFLFLNCPSFGCVRRRSVSTYTSILISFYILILFYMSLFRNIKFI